MNLILLSHLPLKGEVLLLKIIRTSAVNKFLFHLRNNNSIVMNFKLNEGKQSIDLRGDFMKLFNILPKYLRAFNYGGLNLNEIPKELE